MDKCKRFIWDKIPISPELILFTFTLQIDSHKIHLKSPISYKRENSSKLRSSYSSLVFSILVQDNYTQKFCKISRNLEYTHSIVRIQSSIRTENFIYSLVTVIHYKSVPQQKCTSDYSSAYHNYKWAFIRLSCCVYIGYFV